MAFKKIVNPGRIKIGSKLVDVFCRIEFSADGRLSISGVEGPRARGSAAGSCGQIEMHIDPATYLHDGWSTELFAQFIADWREWHLNDLAAGCEHQVGEGWDTGKDLEVVSYKLTSEAHKLRDDVRERAADAALAGKRRRQPGGTAAEAAFNPTPTEIALGQLKDWFKERFAPPDADSPLSGCYEVSKRETKKAGWVRPDEHPGGLLCKPCETCGHAYGSKWLRREVPEEVLARLQALPESAKAPAWV